MSERLPQLDTPEYWEVIREKAKALGPIPPQRRALIEAMTIAQLSEPDPDESVNRDLPAGA